MPNLIIDLIPPEGDTDTEWVEHLRGIEGVMSVSVHVPELQSRGCTLAEISFNRDAGETLRRALGMDVETFDECLNA